MGSSRLPGKVMMDIEGKPLLQRVLDRVKRAETLDDIIVATSNHLEDNQIGNLAHNNHVRIFRGSMDDVLTRYFGAADSYFRMIPGAEDARRDMAIVRITADCPLVDPVVIDNAISLFQDVYRPPDQTIVSNTANFPDGTDVEVFTIFALSMAYVQARRKADREHVTPWMMNNLNVVQMLGGSGRDPKYSIDTQEELELVREIYRKLGDEATPREIVEYIRR